MLFALILTVACLALALSFAGNGLSVKDDNLKVTRALPNGAATVYSDGIDLGAQSGKQDFTALTELLLSAPALVVGDLGNGDTIKYSIQTDSDSAFGSPTTIAADILTQTGAGGAGAAAATARFRLPTNVERYVRLMVVNSAAGDASDKTATLQLVF